MDYLQEVSASLPLRNHEHEQLRVDLVMSLDHHQLMTASTESIFLGLASIQKILPIDQVLRLIEGLAEA
jgi:hypothetical protein